MVDLEQCSLCAVISPVYHGRHWAVHFIETWPSLSPNTLWLYVTYSWVSSAYLWYTTPRLRKIRCIGMAYIGNNIGPNTDPWGTPHARGMGSEMASSILTLCVRDPRYVSSQDSALWCTPNSAFSRDSSWLWSIVSKAADKSSMTWTTACDSSKALDISWWTLSSVFSVLWSALYADWYSSVRLFLDRCSTNRLTAMRLCENYLDI